MNTIIKDGNYKLNSQEINIDEIVKNVVKDNQEEVKRFKKGEEKLLGYFIGEIMKASSGKINHKKIVEVLNKELKKN